MKISNLRVLGVALTMLVLTVLTSVAPLASSAPLGKKGNYIVTFNENVAGDKVSELADNLGRANGFSVKHEYKAALRGFSASMPEARAEALKRNPLVASVVEDKAVEAHAQTNPKGVRRAYALPGQNANRGNGVVVAVIDTGIDLDHPDLRNNIVGNTNCVNPAKNGNDDNGHGTHVAGTVAAAHNKMGVVGVASNAKLVAVKVLDSNSSGTWSQVICGIDWVTANASTYNIKVVNMSLGGGGTSDNNCGYSNNDPFHQAICNSTAAGITYVVSAGNSSTDASGSVPAAYDDTVITVSALVDTDGRYGGYGPSTTVGKDDHWASFSNYGSVVDIGASGYRVLSTYHGGRYAYMSGTSMAAPHVSGGAAMYINSNPGSTWSQVRDGLLNRAETNPSRHAVTPLHPEPVLWTYAL